MRPARDGALEAVLGLSLVGAAVSINVDLPWAALIAPLACALAWRPLRRWEASRGIALDRPRWAALLVLLLALAVFALADLWLSKIVLHWWIRGVGLFHLGVAFALALAVVAVMQHRLRFLAYGAGVAVVFASWSAAGRSPVEALLVAGLVIAAGGALTLARGGRRAAVS